jgi:predicted RNA-binding Zn-ribbon protein involved in translation (DUF1610 family)
VGDETALPAASTALPCPVCQSWFIVRGKQLYCGKLCRDTAYRRRKQSASRPIQQPTMRLQRAVTVYECEACGERSLGSGRCEQCRTFMRKLGLGGICPHCDEPVTVTDVLKEEVVSTGIR